MSILQGSLRTVVPTVITDVTTRGGQVQSLEKVLTNGAGLYICFIKSDLRKFDYNPFGEQAKTCVVYEAYSDAKTDLRECVDDRVAPLLEPMINLPQGQFSLSKWRSSSVFEQRYFEGIPWSFLCRFSGTSLWPFDTERTPEAVYEILISGLKNLFSSCIDEGINIVQLPLLSFPSEDLEDVMFIMIILEILSNLYHVQKRIHVIHPFCVNIVNGDRTPSVVFDALKDL